MAEVTAEEVRDAVRQVLEDSSFSKKEVEEVADLAVERLVPKRRIEFPDGGARSQELMHTLVNLGLTDNLPLVASLPSDGSHASVSAVVLEHDLVVLELEDES